MADWTTITDSQVDPKAPVTSELMTALRDNPVAIAEGATNAPKIAESWRHSYVSSSSGIAMGDIELGGGARVDINAVSNDGGSGSTVAALLSYSTNSGSTWSSEIQLDTQTVGSDPGTTNILGIVGTLMFDSASGDFVYISMDSSRFVSVSNSFGTGANGTTDLRIRFTDNGSPLTGSFRAVWTITGGKAVS